MDFKHSLDIFLHKHPYYTPKEGRTLIAGSKLYEGSVDRRPMYESCFGVDVEEGEGVDLVWDITKPLPESVGTFDHLHCCSLLEHVKEPWLAAENLTKVLVRGGTILFAVPFIWRVHGYPDDYYRFTISAVRALFPTVTWEELTYLDSLGHAVSVPKRIHDRDGRRYMERVEVVGFGVHWP